MSRVDSCVNSLVSLGNRPLGEMKCLTSTTGAMDTHPMSPLGEMKCLGNTTGVMDAITDRIWEEIKCLANTMFGEIGAIMTKGTSGEMKCLANTMFRERYATMTQGLSNNVDTGMRNIIGTTVNEIASND